MAWGDLRKVVRYLHNLTGPQRSSALTDGQLLERYVAQRDEAAFELLLWRHGAMVLNVCRRILRHEHDAEDAFQATFLTFVRKAHSIVRRGAVAGWLYRVAYRVALELKDKAGKTAQRERQADSLSAVEAPPDPVWLDVRPLLDEEMNRLPERLRLPLVLCYLEGKTNDEAARLLGCPPGTIFSRLARGRELLRNRLVRRGVVLSTSVLTALVCRNAVSAALASPLVDATFKSALLFAAKRTAAGGASARVIALTEGVLQAMYLTKLKVLAVLLLMAGLLATGGILTHHALTAAPPQDAVKEDTSRPAETPTTAQKAKEEPAVVRVMTPQPGRFEDHPTLSCSVLAFDESEIFAVVSGVLKGQTVDIGSRVKKGEVLAEIDAPLLVLEAKQAEAALKQAQGQVLEAEARWAAARAEVKVAKTLVRQRQAEVDNVKVALSSHQRKFERLKRLLATKSVDVATIDEQEGLVAAAQAQVGAADAGLANAGADVEVKEGKVKQAESALATTRANLEAVEVAVEKAQYSLSLAKITSPFDGVVTKRSYRDGHYIRSSDQGGRLPLLTVARLDVMRMVFLVPEDYVQRTEPGTPVDLRIASLPDVPFSGYKVSRIAFAQDEAQRSMRVEIDIPNPKQLLRPGMAGYVTLHFPQKGSPQVLRIRLSSLVRGRIEGTAMLYVVREGKAHLVPVQTSRTGGEGEVEILSGLKPTDLVVIDPKGLTGDVVPTKIKTDSGSK
jgi:RND family efflux transporter MFP subunit